MVLQDILDSITYDMKFTLEEQGDFGDNFLPTLDFKIQWDPRQTPIIRYKFFKKEVSTKLAILKTSALSDQIKSSTMVQETMRRMKHTDVMTSQDERNCILEEYIETLRIFNLS